MKNSNVSINHYKVLDLPTRPNKNSVYYVLDSSLNVVRGYITDLNGIPIKFIDLSGNINSVTGTGVTGTLANPKVDIATFVSAQLGNLISLSTDDGKLVVKPITSPDGYLEITETVSELQIELSSAILNQINTALQPGDNISELVNDAGYLVSADFSNVVYINSTNPSTATIFDLDNPPTVNNDSLKEDVSNLYIGTDGSTWTYKTSPAGYNTYNVASGSNFYLSGGTIDAGSNKTNAIKRDGSIEAPAFIATNETVNTIASFDNNKHIKSLTTTTYPSLTELSYIKGATSSIQTQINSKANASDIITPQWGNIVGNLSDQADLTAALDLKLDKGSYSGTASDLVLGKQISDAPEKTTISDNDKIGISDSENSNNSKYWKFSTVKSVLKTYFDSFYITLTGSHTISGLKTFLHGSLGLRNGTNTVTSYFSNDNTSTRTYTLQNRSGTLLDNTDLAAINASISDKQVKDNQVEVSINSNVQNSWHGQTILFTSTCTITVPATLNNSLMFAFRTLAGVTVTWAITSPFTWETTPLATPEKTVGHFMRRGSTNVIFLDV